MGSNAQVIQTILVIGRTKRPLKRNNTSREETSRNYSKLKQKDDPFKVELAPTLHQRVPSAGLAAVGVRP